MRRCVPRVKLVNLRQVSHLSLIVNFRLANWMNIFRKDSSNLWNFLRRNKHYEFCSFLKLSSILIQHLFEIARVPPPFRQRQFHATSQRKFFDSLKFTSEHLCEAQRRHLQSGERSGQIGPVVGAIWRTNGELTARRAIR